ncbi:hypothetical protein ACLKA7_016183 [Drosophila subpalustris]
MSISRTWDSFRGACHKLKVSFIFGAGDGAEIRGERCSTTLTVPHCAQYQLLSPQPQPAGSFDESSHCPGGRKLKLNSLPMSRSPMERITMII